MNSGGHSSMANPTAVSRSPSFSPSYQSISYQDQLRSTVNDKLSYLSNIFGNQSELVQRFEWENRQLRLLVSVLLHFKHMFLYLNRDLDLVGQMRHRSGDEAMLLKTDLDHCLAKFASITRTDHSRSNHCFDFVVEKENNYYRNNSRYQPYQEEMTGGGFDFRHSNLNLHSSFHSEHSRAPRHSSAHSINNSSSSHGAQVPKYISRSTNNNNNNLDSHKNTQSNNLANVSPQSNSSIELLESISNSSSTAQQTNRQTTPSGEGFHSSLNNTGNNAELDIFDSLINSANSANSSNSNDVPMNEGQMSHQSSTNDDHRQHRLTDSGHSSFRHHDEQSNNTYNNNQNNNNSNNTLETTAGQYFSCSHPQCIYKSKSWTQVQAHEFRRHIRPKSPDVSIKQEQHEQEEEDHQSANSNQQQMDVASSSSSSLMGALMSSSLPSSSAQQQQHSVQFGTDCRLCHKHFRTPDRYTVHLERWHQEGHFPCSVNGCSFSARNRFDLALHGKQAHTTATPERRRRPPKSVPCTWPGCAKMFHTHTMLRNHLRCHLKYKKFRCKWPDCGYASELDSNVIRHIRIRHFHLPTTMKEQIQLNIANDRNPHDFMEVMPDDVVI